MSEKTTAINKDGNLKSFENSDNGFAILISIGIAVVSIIMGYSLLRGMGL